MKGLLISFGVFVGFLLVGVLISFVLLLTLPYTLVIGETVMLVFAFISLVCGFLAGLIHGRRGLFIGFILGILEGCVIFFTMFWFAPIYLSFEFIVVVFGIALFFSMAGSVTGINIALCLGEERRKRAENNC